MTPDSFTVTTRHGFGSRFRSSLSGALVGIVLFLVSFPLLWTNEGRAVRRAQTLHEGRGAVVSVAANAVDPNHEGALVHLTGMATTADQLADTAFAITVNAIRLVRDVEMYQWVEDVKSERKTKVGGSEEVTKTYSYQRKWEDSLIDSASFQEPGGHANPDSMPYAKAELSATDVRVGPFRLSDSLAGQIGGAEPIPVTDQMLAAMPEEVRAHASLHNQGLFLGESPASPQLGDLRIQFSQVPPQTVSVVGQQAGDRIGRYTLKKGSIEMLQAGELLPDAMFDQAEQQNKMLTWILRLVGFVLMSIGLASVFGPIAVATDILPFLGRLSRAGINFFSFIIGISLSLLTIAIAWIAYRPLLGVSLLATAALALFAIKSLSADKYQTAPPPPPPPPPPA